MGLVNRNKKTQLDNLGVQNRILGVKMHSFRDQEKNWLHVITSDTEATVPYG